MKLKNNISRLSIATISSILFVFIVNLFASLISSIISQGMEKTDPNLKLYIMGAMFFSYIIVVLISIFLKRVPSFSKLSIKPTLIALVLPIGIIIIALLWGLFSLNTSVPQKNASTQGIVTYAGQLPFLVTWVFPIIIAPIFEEYIYRGLIGEFFQIKERRDKGTMWTFIIVSSLLFGLLHLQVTGSPYTRLTSFLMPAVSGVIFSSQYFKTKNLIYSMITHSLFNFIVILTLT